MSLNIVNGKQLLGLNSNVALACRYHLAYTAAGWAQAFQHRSLFKFISKPFPAFSVQSLLLLPCKIPQVGLEGVMAKYHIAHQVMLRYCL